MIRRSIGHNPRAWQRLLAGLAMALLVPHPASAKVQEIRILAAGVDPMITEADTKALEYARYRAVYLAVKKLGVKDPDKASAKLTAEQLSQIIRGTTVLQNKRVGTVTYQEVLVTIVDEPLRKALGLPAAEAETVNATPRIRGLLVLPVLMGKDRPYMWEKENSLKPLLEDALRRQSHGTVMLAGGDFDDLRLVDYQNVLKVKPEELGPMFERYGAEEIIITVVTPGTPGTGEPTNILLRRLTPKETHTETIDVPPTGSEEPADQRLSDTVTALAGAVTEIASSTSASDQAMLAKATKIPVRFLYANPRELATLEQGIRSAPGVILLEFPTISLKDVGATIYLSGDPEALKTTLTKQGIRVNVLSERWQVSLR